MILFSLSREVFYELSLSRVCSYVNVEIGILKSWITFQLNQRCCAQSSLWGECLLPKTCFYKFDSSFHLIYLKQGNSGVQ